jgi:hypothetical protein
LGSSDSIWDPFLKENEIEYDRMGKIQVAKYTAITFEQFHESQSSWPFSTFPDKRRYYLSIYQNQIDNF